MRRLLLALLILAALGSARAAEPFTVGTLSAKAGEKVSGFLEVPAGVDAGTRIPVTVIHGTRPGPVLALKIGRAHV